MNEHGFHMMWRKGTRHKEKRESKTWARLASLYVAGLFGILATLICCPFSTTLVVLFHVLFVPFILFAVVVFVYALGAFAVAIYRELLGNPVSNESGGVCKSTRRFAFGRAALCVCLFLWPLILSALACAGATLFGRWGSPFVDPGRLFFGIAFGVSGAMMRSLPYLRPYFRAKGETPPSKSVWDRDLDG